MFGLFLTSGVGFMGFYPYSHSAKEELTDVILIDGGEVTAVHILVFNPRPRICVVVFIDF